MLTLIKQPLTAVVITLSLYVLTRRLYNKYHLLIFNPLIMAPVIIITLLLLTGINYNTYNIGGSIISVFLGPATVALAVPLYRQVPVLKANLWSILIGITAGSTTGIVSVVLIAKGLGASTKTLLSLAPKSTTMPIALGISEKLNGIASLTTLGVVFAGVFGGIAGPEILRLFRVKNKVAFGVAIGTASHSGGTSRLIQIGETESSMSGAAIVITGIATAVIVQLILKFIL